MLKFISNMPVKTASKSTAAVRVRRSSSSSHKRRSKHREKDTDTASVITSSTNSTDVFDNETRCPMHYLLGMLDHHRHHENGKKQCPLRRARLWYTIPLCLLAVINLLLVVVALLGLASWKAIVQVGTVVEGFVRMEVRTLSQDVVGADINEKLVRGKDYVARD